MELENLYLEVTRNCTLECEHCLRGEKQQENMNITTLENSLREVKKIGTLLLTGGEPLLNIKVLEALPKIIKKYSIVIKRIGIITNGTVNSIRHKKALEEIKKSCQNLEIYISYDVFHRLEWKRLGIESLVEKNAEEWIKEFQAEKFLENDNFHRVILNPSGRAKNLSKERMKDIYNKYYIELVMKEPYKDSFYKEENQIKGKVFINVYGYFSNYNESFEREDETSSIDKNVNIVPLSVIIENILEEESKVKKINVD